VDGAVQGALMDLGGGVKMCVCVCVGGGGVEEGEMWFKGGMVVLGCVMDLELAWAEGRGSHEKEGEGVTRLGVSGVEGVDGAVQRALK